MEYLEIKSFFHNTTTTLEDRSVTMHIENFENGNLENVSEVTLKDLEKRILKLEMRMNNEI